MKQFSITPLPYPIMFSYLSPTTLLLAIYTLLSSSCINKPLPLAPYSNTHTTTANPKIIAKRLAQIIAAIELNNTYEFTAHNGEKISCQKQDTTIWHAHVTRTLPGGEQHTSLLPIQCASDENIRQILEDLLDQDQAVQKQWIHVYYPSDTQTGKVYLGRMGLLGGANQDYKCEGCGRTINPTRIHLMLPCSAGWIHGMFRSFKPQEVNSDTPAKTIIPRRPANTFRLALSRYIEKAKEINQYLEECITIKNADAANKLLYDLHSFTGLLNDLATEAQRIDTAAYEKSLHTLHKHLTSELAAIRKTTQSTANNLRKTEALNKEKNIYDQMMASADVLVNSEFSKITSVKKALYIKEQIADARRQLDKQQKVIVILIRNNREKKTFGKKHQKNLKQLLKGEKKADNTIKRLAASSKAERKILAQHAPAPSKSKKATKTKPRRTKPTPTSVLTEEQKTLLDHFKKTKKTLHKTLVNAHTPSKHTILEVPFETPALADEAVAYYLRTWSKASPQSRKVMYPRGLAILKGVEALKKKMKALYRETTSTFLMTDVDPLAWAQVGEKKRQEAKQALPGLRNLRKQLLEALKPNIEEKKACKLRIVPHMVADKDDGFYSSHEEQLTSDATNRQRKVFFKGIVRALKQKVTGLVDILEDPLGTVQIYIQKLLSIPEVSELLEKYRKQVLQEEDPDVQATKMGELVVDAILKVAPSLKTVVIRKLKGMNILLGKAAIKALMKAVE